MAEGVGSGGEILGLLDLIEEHRAAVSYDFRTRFHLSAGVIGTEVDWAEAVDLVGILRADPSSAIAAAIEGWDYPISREALAILDLYDLTMAANSDPKKGPPKRHGGRPMKIDDRNRQQIGKMGSRTREEVVAFVRGLGHNIPA